MNPINTEQMTMNQNTLEPGGEFIRLDVQLAVRAAGARRSTPDIPPTLSWRLVRLALTIMAAVAALAGCAGFPTFPTNEGSRAAETTWLALDAIDTAQTMQFVKKPACYHEADPFAAHIYGGQNPPAGRVLAINTVLALVHPAVSRWFDDHADAAYEADDDTVGLWYVGRGLWHIISIAASAKSVANNFSRGITPFGARCDAGQ